jgi:hypothetical protein
MVPRDVEYEWSPSVYGSICQHAARDRRGRYSHRKCAIPIISTMAIAKMFREVKRRESKFLKNFRVDKSLVFRLMSGKKASRHNFQRVLSVPMRSLACN